LLSILRYLITLFLLRRYDFVEVIQAEGSRKVAHLVALVELASLDKTTTAFYAIVHYLVPEVHDDEFLKAKPNFGGSTAPWDKENSPIYFRRYKYVYEIQSNRRYC
jgi:hypothetical protein